MDQKYVVDLPYLEDQCVFEPEGQASLTFPFGQNRRQMTGIHILA